MKKSTDVFVAKIYDQITMEILIFYYNLYVRLIVDTRTVLTNKLEL